MATATPSRWCSRDRLADGSDYPDLREALDKLKLNDAALVYEPETSVALGFGFRCGFLGLLHLEIVRERLEREFDLELISTQPNVVYEVAMEDGTTITVIMNPSELLGQDRRGSRAQGARHHPGCRASSSAPSWSFAMREARCSAWTTSPRSVEMRYTLPMAEVVFDFFDQLEVAPAGTPASTTSSTATKGSPTWSRWTSCSRETVDAFSAIVHKDKAYGYGVMMAGKLKELIPRQQFAVLIRRIAVGARVIARENIRAIRKDVLLKCYGDISRKRKLLEKQKAGKKRMKNIGSVEVPPEAFIAALTRRRRGRRQPRSRASGRAAPASGVRSAVRGLTVGAAEEEHCGARRETHAPLSVPPPEALSSTNSCPRTWKQLAVLRVPRVRETAGRRVDDAPSRALEDDLLAGVPAACPRRPGGHRHLRVGLEVAALRSSGPVQKANASCHTPTSGNAWGRRSL